VKIYNRHKYETEMREAVNTYEEWFIKNILEDTTVRSFPNELPRSI